MIWKRAIASQMTDAEYIRSKAEFTCKKYILDARGSKRIFDGWQKVWDYGGQTDAYLPELKVGDNVKAISVTSEEKETQPPSRFSEASTVKNMEKLGIGRPSTFASVLETLKSRKYIEIQKKAIHTTELGVRVSNFLVDTKFCFVDFNFTSEMEAKLDEIANNKNDKLSVLTEFWIRLKQDIANAKEKKKTMGKTDHKCKECGSYLVKKYSSFGGFYGCSNYPDCKKIYQIGENEEPVEKAVKKVEYSNEVCPNCGKKMAIRKSKYGEFLGCSGFPKCKTMMKMDGTVIEKKSGYKKKFSKKKTKKKTTKKTKKKTTKNK